MNRAVIISIALALIVSVGCAQSESALARSASAKTSGTSAIHPPGEPAPFMLNGKPFFPIALWGQGGYPGKESAYLHMKELVDAGFNQIEVWVGPTTAVKTPEYYVKFLDDAQDHGLTIRFMIYPFAGTSRKKIDPATKKPVKDAKTDKPVWELVNGWPTYKSNLEQFVQTVRGHKALSGYATWDEPYWNLMNGKTLPSCEAFADLNETIRKLDPDHRVVCNFAPWYQVKHLCTFAGYQKWTSVATAFTMDVYPVGLPCYENSVKLNSVAQSFTKLKEIVSDDSVPLGMILQGCAWKEMGGKAEYSKRPTLADTRFMIYDSIVHGAKSIEWYGQQGIKPEAPLWKHMKACTRQLAALQDILAAGATVASGGYTVPENLNAICKQYPVGNGPKYLIVTNPSETPQAKVKMAINRWSGRSVTAMFENRTLRARSGHFTDDFTPWGVHIYTTK